MATKRIIELQETSFPSSGMYFVVDSENNGTKKVVAHFVAHNTVKKRLFYVGM